MNIPIVRWHQSFLFPVHWIRLCLQNATKHEYPPADRVAQRRTYLLLNTILHVYIYRFRSPPAPGNARRVKSKWLKTLRPVALSALHAPRDPTSILQVGILPFSFILCTLTPHYIYSLTLWPHVNDHIVDPYTLRVVRSCNRAPLDVYRAPLHLSMAPVFSCWIIANAVRQVPSVSVVKWI